MSRSGDDLDLPQLVSVLLDMGVSSPAADLDPSAFENLGVNSCILIKKCPAESYASSSK